MNPFPDLDAEVAVQKLINRQGLEGAASEYVPGYLNEVTHMMSRRFELIEGVAEDRVRSTSPVVSLRMILECKKDGRRKARLVLQGFKEPREWDLDSNASPVAYSSSVRKLIYINYGR